MRQNRALRIAAIITPHGFGHAAIVSSVLTAVVERRPDTELVLVSTVSEEFLRDRLPVPFTYIRRRAMTDFGLCMSSSTSVRQDESAGAYAAAHSDWGARVAEESALLAELRPDIVVTSASYAAVAGAAAIGVPSLALGPFSWAEMYRTYCGGHPKAPQVLSEIRAAYEQAHAFVRTEPAVPIDLLNVRTVGPVARLGRDRRAELAQRLDLAPGERVAFMSLGGIDEQIPLSDWPRWNGWRLLISGRGTGGAVAIGDLGFSVSDAVMSSDAVITKPGYGTFVEAGCGGIPLLYRARPDWPETPGLVDWLSRMVPVNEVTAEEFTSGEMAGKLDEVASSGRGGRTAPRGNDEAAEIVLKLAA